MKRSVTIVAGMLLVALLGLTVSAQVRSPGGCLPEEQGSALLCPGEGQILEWLMRDSRVIDELALEPEKRQAITKRLFECHRKMIEWKATIQKAFVTQAELLSEVATNESELIKNIEMLGDANLKLAKLELGELTVLRKALSREQFMRIQFAYRQRGDARGVAPMAGPAGVGMAPGGMPGMGPMGSAPMPPPMPGLTPPPPPPPPPPDSGVGSGGMPAPVAPPPASSMPPSMPPAVAPSVPPPMAAPSMATGAALPPLPAEPEKKVSPVRTR